MRRKTKEDYHELAKSCGFKWVGPVLPKDNKDPTWWECEELHRWEARYNNIQQGTNCPICKRKTKEDYYKLAKSGGIKWIGDTLPKTIIIPTMWECEEGHRWETIYTVIKKGSGCPVCSGKAKKTKKDYHRLAKSRGFKWVGPFPKSTHDPTWWECKEGHKWKTSYHKIQGGSGCHTCKDMVNGAYVSKPQRELNVMLFGSLNHPEGRRRIDVAIMRSSQKIAVEYDCWYWHKGNEKRETKRDKYLINKGWKILHVKAGVLLPTRKQLTTAIRYLLKTDDKVYNLYLEDWK